MIPMPRFPSPGSSRAEFPGFLGTIKALRPPAGPPAALRFLRLAVPREHARFVPTAAACGGSGPGVGHPVSPSGNASVETTESPKFLGNPHSRLRMFSDPGRPVRLRPTTRRPLGPRFLNNEGADHASVSGLNSMAFGIAAYVSRDGCPPNRARLASRCWSGSPGRAFTRRAPLKGFQITSCELSSFPKLLGTIKS
jgi:hypothetical protein